MECMVLMCRVTDSSLVVYSKDNILEYFFNSGNELDSYLINFINSEAMELSFSVVSEDYAENAQSVFFNAILRSAEINNDRYLKILKSTGRSYKSFAIENLDYDKVSILIDINIIRMAQTSLLFMRENYPDNIQHYIEKNIHVYANEVINEENFDFEEMMYILSAEVNDKYKLKLLELTSKPITIINTLYSETIKVYLLNNNLDNDDLEEMFCNYDSYSNNIKQTILELAINNKDIIINVTTQL